MALYVNSCIYSHMQQPRVRVVFVIFPHERDWMRESIFDFNTSIGDAYPCPFELRARIKVVESPIGDFTLIHLYVAGETERRRERERDREEEISYHYSRGLRNCL